MGFKEKIKIFWPAVLVLLVVIGYVLYRLSIKGWHPVELAEIGTRYRDGEINGSEGYDGQFAYYIAIHPKPDEVSSQLDVPAYRYQRILYPLFARTISFGQVDWIPWSLIFINILSQVGGTALLCKLLTSMQIPVRYSLIYGLWAGLIVSVGTDLYEPLAYGLVVAAMVARSREKDWISSIFLACSLLTKETVLPFWLALVLADLFQQKGLKEILITLLPGILYGFWQGWLYLQFGAFGLGSGGAMATPFEWIPYGGFFRIGSAGIEVLVLFILIFGPTILLPNFWGTITSLRMLLRGFRDFETWSLLLNTLFITFLPFSTFREPLGLVRVSTGMVLMQLVFAAKQDLRRPLNLAMFWIALLVLVIS
ncbi:MAG: hypothetical protein A2Z14_09255 [Chloroflexi bacterium RBG_16_48_8]|nr:MAG: hypothetical protein A2Z14_09255 [Chloroflexi bacterium RBG_16_48_8]